MARTWWRKTKTEQDMLLEWMSGEQVCDQIVNFKRFEDDNNGSQWRTLLRVQNEDCTTLWHWLRMFWRKLREMAWNEPQTREWWMQLVYLSSSELRRQRNASISVCVKLTTWPKRLTLRFWNMFGWCIYCVTMTVRLSWKTMSCREICKGDDGNAGLRFNEMSAIWCARHGVTKLRPLSCFIFLFLLKEYVSIVRFYHLCLLLHLQRWGMVERMGQVKKVRAAVYVDALEG